MSSITLITGGLGDGKSTTSKLLAKHFPRCLLIPVDDLREMVVTGQATPAGGLTGELIGQFQLARASAIRMARVYAEQGMDVIIDDVCYPSMFADHYAPLLDVSEVRAFLLMPKLETLIGRIRARAGPWDHILINKVADLYETLEQMDKSRWIVLDTSEWTVERSVEEVLLRLGMAASGNGEAGQAEDTKTPERQAQIRTFARRYTAAWCSQTAAGVAAFYSPQGSLTINEGSPSVGRAAITEAARGFMMAFPDLRVSMDDLIFEEDRVIYKWSLEGTNDGPGGSGRRVRISGHEAWQIGEDGLIAVSSGHFDEADYARQIDGN